MTKLQYPLCGLQVCLQRAECLTCLLYTIVRLRQEGGNRYLCGIRHEDKWQIEIWVGQHGGCTQPVLHNLKRLLLTWTPI